MKGINEVLPFIADRELDRSISKTAELPFDTDKEN